VQRGEAIQGFVLEHRESYEVERFYRMSERNENFWQTNLGSTLSAILSMPKRRINWHSTPITYTIKKKKPLYGVVG